MDILGNKFSIAMLQTDIGCNQRRENIREFTIFTNSIYELLILSKEFQRYSEFIKVYIPWMVFDSKLIECGYYGPIKKFRYLFSEEDLNTNKLRNIYYGVNTKTRYFIFFSITYLFKDLDKVCDLFIYIFNKLRFRLVRRGDLTTVLKLEKDYIKSYLTAI